MLQSLKGAKKGAKKRDLRVKWNILSETSFKTIGMEIHSQWYVIVFPNNPVRPHKKDPQKQQSLARSAALTGWTRPADDNVVFFYNKAKPGTHIQCPLVRSRFTTDRYSKKSGIEIRYYNQINSEILLFFGQSLFLSSTFRHPGPVQPTKKTARRNIYYWQASSAAAGASFAD